MSVGQYAWVPEQSAETLSKAIVVWTGYGVTAHPERDNDRVVEQFGAEVAVELMPLISALEDDFYRSSAHQTVQGLDEMAAQAALEFRVRQPGISDAAVDALAWCYSYDWGVLFLEAAVGLGELYDTPLV